MTESGNDSNVTDLKTARENSGLTLKELFERTRISVVNLEAIENGDFQLLPVPICARNFIKTYTDAIGVDSGPVLTRYENYLQGLQMKAKTRSAENPPRVPLAEILKRYKTYLWALGIVFVMAAASFFVSFYNKPLPDLPQKTGAAKEVVTAESPAQNAAQPEILTTVTTPVKEETPPAQKTEEAQTPQSTATVAASQTKEVETPMTAEEPSVLIVTANQETWIRIKADDKEPFQVLLKPGEKISHKAARFNMDIGNAGGVRIEYDGKNIENLGKSGQVIHLRLQ